MNDKNDNSGHKMIYFENKYCTFITYKWYGIRKV